MRYAAILGLLVSLAAQNSKPQDLLKRAERIKFSDRSKAEKLTREALRAWDASNAKNPEYADAEVFLSLLMLGSQTHRRGDLKAEVQPLIENAIDVYDHATPQVTGRRLALAVDIQARILRLANDEDLANPISERAKQIRAEMLRQAAPLPWDSTGARKIGGGVSAPAIISKVEPEYSEEARLAQIQGAAVLYVIVEPNGIASHIRVVKRLGFGLDEQAVEAVRKWHFKPGMKDGEPVRVFATIEVNFVLL